MTPLRVALVGCGKIAQAVYAPLLARSRHARLVAVVDPVAANREALGRQFRGASQWEGIESLLAAEAIDAAIIAAPTGCHEALGTTFLQRRIPVHIEKPLATDAAGAERLRGVETQQGRPLVSVGFNFRFNPSVEALKASIQAAGPGGEGIVRTAFSTPRFARATARSPAAAREVLTDLGCHHFDLIEFLLEDDIEAGSLQAVVMERRAAVGVQGRTTKGIAFQLCLTDCGPLDHRIEYLGPEWRMAVDIVRGLVPVRRSNRGFPVSILEDAWSCLSQFRPGRLRQRLTAPWCEPSYERALDAFFAGVRSGRFAVGSDAGVRAAILVDAAVASLASSIAAR